MIAPETGWGLVTQRDMPTEPQGMSSMRPSRQISTVESFTHLDRLPAHAAGNPQGSGLGLTNSQVEHIEGPPFELRQICLAVGPHKNEVMDAPVPDSEERATQELHDSRRLIRESAPHMTSVLPSQRDSPDSQIAPLHRAPLDPTTQVPPRAAQSIRVGTLRPSSQLESQFPMQLPDVPSAGLHVFAGPSAGRDDDAATQESNCEHDVAPCAHAMIARTSATRPPCRQMDSKLLAPLVLTAATAPVSRESAARIDSQPHPDGRMDSVDEARERTDAEPHAATQRHALRIPSRGRGRTVVGTEEGGVGSPVPPPSTPPKKPPVPPTAGLHAASTAVSKNIPNRRSMVSPVSPPTMDVRSLWRGTTRRSARISSRFYRAAWTATSTLADAPVPQIFMQLAYIFVSGASVPYEATGESQYAQPAVDGDSEVALPAGSMPPAPG